MEGTAGRVSLDNQFKSDFFKEERYGNVKIAVREITAATPESCWCQNSKMITPRESGE